MAKSKRTKRRELGESRETNVGPAEITARAIIEYLDLTDAFERSRRKKIPIVWELRLGQDQLALTKALVRILKEERDCQIEVDEGFGGLLNIYQK